MTSELTVSENFELIVNWFLNLLVCNVIEREIKREKIQMKPPKMDDGCIVNGWYTHRSTTDLGYLKIILLDYFLR